MWVETLDLMGCVQMALLFLHRGFIIKAEERGNLSARPNEAG